MKIHEIREQTTEDLENMEKDLSRELWQARFDNHTNQLDDTSQIGKLRRRIAQVKTVLTERRDTADSTAAAQE